MKGTVTSIFGVLIVATLVLMAVPASADERGLTVEVDEDTKVEIRSESQVATNEIDFKFKAESANRPKLAVAVERERENATVEVEIEVEFSAAFREVFEFEDSNGNGLQDSNEGRLSEVRLDSLSFAPVEVVSHQRDGLDGFKVTLSGTKDGFTFGLVSYIFPSEATINGTLVPEEAVKVDILIEGYDFVSETSLLGLEIGAESSVEQETEFEDGSESVEVHVARGTAYFRWAPQARVDNQVSPVGAQWSSVDDRLFLYYPQGEVIVHDPLLGFEAATPSPFLNAVTIALIGGIALAAAVAGLVLVRLRTRR